MNLLNERAKSIDEKEQKHTRKQKRKPGRSKDHPLEQKPVPLGCIHRSVSSTFFRDKALERNEALTHHYNEPL